MTGAIKAKRATKFVLVAAGIGFLAVPPSSAEESDPGWIARGKKVMVATESAQASKAGLEMLKAGGNAVDAAVAASFVLAVTHPWHTGLGGGGFMIARMANGRVVVQDFRETAPAAATSVMFVKETKGLPSSEVGWQAVAVPGLVAGRCQALAQHGKLPLDKILAPAIRLAEEGFPVNDAYVEAVAEVAAEFEKYPHLKTDAAYLWRTHAREGNPRKAGDTLQQPELARLLRGLAEKGPDFFYKGPVAESLAAAMKKNGGLITKADLETYQVKIRQPLIATYRDYTLLLMPPPSSGGVAIAQTLNILEVLNFAAFFQQDPIHALHYEVEAMKHAFADRSAWLGDPDFVPDPSGRLIDKRIGRQLAAFVSGTSGEVRRYGATQLPDDGGTSHISVVDAEGNVVVTTETINTTFGSLMAVDEWGLILNNEMDDFTTKPGQPNAFGLVQGQPNVIAPKKRPLSSMSPTIVLKGDQPALMLGAAGGPRIITSVIHVLLGVLDGNMSLEKAVARPRVHHQWRPNEVYFDELPPPEELANPLREKGHTVSDKKKRAVVAAIMRTDDGWIGASDPRGGGQPAGE